MVKSQLPDGYIVQWVDLTFDPATVVNCGFPQVSFHARDPRNQNHDIVEVGPEPKGAWPVEDVDFDVVIRIKKAGREVQVSRVERRWGPDRFI